MSAALQNNEVDSAKVPFEEALNRTGFGRYSFTLTALTGMSIISFVCIVYGSTIIVPTSACELATTSAQQGLLVAVPLIGTIIGALLWGYLGDTRGRKSMLLVSFVSGAGCNAIASISVNWIMLMVFQFTASLLASGQYTLSMTILSESVLMARRNLVLLLVASIFLLAQGIMAVLAIPIIPLSFSHYLPALGIFWNSWRTLMLVYCIPPLLCALWLSFMQESPKYVFAKGSEEEALAVLRAIHRINNAGSKEEFQVKGLLQEVTQGPEVKPGAKDQIVPLFKWPLLKYTIIMTTLSMFLQIGSFMVWLPTIANQFVVLMQMGEGSDLTLCGIIAASQDAPPDPDAVPCALNVTALLIVFGVGALQSLVNALLSLVINRAGRRNIVMAVTAICGISGLVVNWVPNAIGSAVLFVVFLLGMLVIGLYTAITVALFPTHLRALAVSLTMTGGRVANFGVIQLLNYLLIDNCNLGFYIFTSIFAASAIVAAFLPDDRYLLRPKVPAVESKQEEVQRSSTNAISTDL